MTRPKRILKWIAISAACLIAVLLAANAYFVWSTGTALEGRLSELRSGGSPVQLADLAPEPIPPDQNADTFLQRAAGDLDAIQNELLALFPGVILPDRALTPAELASVRKVFDHYPRVIPLLEQAAACPGYAPPVDTSLTTSQYLEPLMQRLGRNRLVSRVLWARALWLSAEARADEAVEDALLLLRISRHWTHEVQIVAFLTTKACQDQGMAALGRAMQSGPVSASRRKELDAELARHDTLNGLRATLRGERAFSLSSVREFPNARFWLTRGFTNRIQLTIIDGYDRALLEVERPFVQAARAVPGGNQPAAGLSGALLDLLVPAFGAARDSAERIRARSRCLRVLNALQSQNVPGDRPVDLASLGLNPEVIIDPFDGQPLRVKKRPEGWLVYSVGKNLADDGGTLEKGVDVGVGPRAPDDSLRIKLQGDSNNKFLKDQSSDPPR